MSSRSLLTLAVSLALLVGCPKPTPRAPAADTEPDASLPADVPAIPDPGTEPPDEGVSEPPTDPGAVEPDLPEPDEGVAPKPDAGSTECPEFADGVLAGTVENSAIIEISGIVASRKQADVLWIHNDSGDGPWVHAMSPAGVHRGSFLLNGATAFDWEDIAIGPDEQGTDHLFLADIGDNLTIRSEISVFVVPEPLVGEPGEVTLSNWVELRLAYPDGAHDAETLLFDPASRDLFILTKDWSGGVSALYRYPAPYRPEEKVTLELVTTVDLSSAASISGRLATAGDVAPDGSEVIIRTYADAWLWRRPPGSTLAQAFAGERCPIPTRTEPQGEAIGFTPDGQAYFTVSEEANQPIWRFVRQ